MTKEEKVISAVNDFNTGKAIKFILQRYGCSKSWLYKWISRYKKDPLGDWYIEQSRKPKNVRKTLLDATEKAVVDIRNTLENKPYSQRGAISIQYELQAQKQEVLPVWKINKILSRSGLNKKKDKVPKRVNEYPYTGLVIDQMDFVGPCYIKNDGRFYSLNIIDTTTHFAQINLFRSMQAENVLQSVIRFWQQRGMPDFLQMDNGLSFRGSNKHPRSFGSLIRLALSLHITPLFIPIKEPWRNGIIEKFNDSFRLRFLQRKSYDNFEQMRQCSFEFEQYHNSTHRYNAHHNQTPMLQLQQEFAREQLNPDFIIRSSRIPINHGKIVLIRFIRSNLVLNIFGEKFLLPKHLMYSYVEATIDVSDEMLYVLRDGILHWRTGYRLP
jgi:transposase